MEDLSRRLKSIGCDCNDDFICPMCEAADALEAQAKRIEELEAEPTYKEGRRSMQDECVSLALRVEVGECAIEEIREIKP
jgi:hypothetical protein